MKKTILSAIASAVCLIGTTAAACDYPDRPHIPDGATASKDELLAAKNSVQDYLAAVDEYLSCIETEEREAVGKLDSPDDETLAARDQALNQKFDAANEEKAMVGEQFNQQIRAYNEKRKNAN